MERIGVMGSDIIRLEEVLGSGRSKNSLRFEKRVVPRFIELRCNTLRFCIEIPNISLIRGTGMAMRPLRISVMLRCSIGADWSKV